MGAIWKPNAGPQEAFLRSNAFELLFGGQAGGGKSEVLLAGYLTYVDRPRYRGVIFRRSFPELERSVIERSRQLFTGWGEYNDAKHFWRFPSGAVLEFSYLDRDSDVHKYQSAEFQYVAWDELTTQPTEYPYTYMISRMRSSDGIPLRLRAATNPGGPGEPWVLRRFAPWLYQPGYYLDEYSGPYAASGERHWFCRLDGHEQLVDEDDEIECGSCGAVWSATERPPADDKRLGCDHPVARSRVFIRSTLEDNPYLAADGEYQAGLQALDPLTYAKLRGGDWMARPAPGMFFKKGWFQVEDRPPARTEFEAIVRYWDRAATEPDETNPEPDWTAGVLEGRDRHGLLWVLDVARERVEPHAVEDLIRETAKADVKRWGKKLVTVGLEQDPGSAGKTEIAHMTKQLQGYAVEVNKPTGDKVTRAKPWSSQAKAGNVRMLKAPWNRRYVDEHVAFPFGANDDQVDGSSGAFSVLMRVVGKGRAKTGGKRSYANALGGF